MALFTPHIEMLSLEPEFARRVIKLNSLPCLRRVTQFTPTKGHKRTELPFMRILMTRFARAIRETELRLRCLRFLMTRNAWHCAVRRGQRECRRVLGNGKCRGGKSVFGMALRAVVRICFRELSFMIIGVAIGA